MILRSIEIENFGLYAGVQRLGLIPQRGRPVVLFGGKNGAGKTTLLEAVRLALYGRRALGYRVGQSEYDDHLRRRMHVAADGTAATVTSVGLEFDYAEGGVVQRYRVTRSWTGRGAKPVETLTLEKDGLPVDSVPRDEWASFLQELIPPGVSQLFFFDGEKIAEIARDDPDEGLAEAVRGLLGIELVGRLRTDLGLYMARRSRRGDDGVGARLEAATRDIAVLGRRIAQMSEEVAELTTRRTTASRVAAAVRQRFIAEGGDAAGRRAALEATKAEIGDQARRREGELRELANGLLPFALAPKLTARLLGVLGADAGTGPDDARTLRSRLAAWRAAATPARAEDWREGHWGDLERLIASIEADASTSAPTVGGLEPGERERVAKRLAEARELVPARVRVIVEELDAGRRRLQEVSAELVRASGHAAGPVLDELVVAEQQVGAAEAEHRARSEELRVLEYQRAAQHRERDRLLKEQTETELAEGRTELAARVAKALQQYEERLLDQKIGQLRHEFVDRFNHLARKDGLVADVRIDRSTFDATLIDAHGAEIAKSSLSAGEKQVYAIAMLWALARTSGRALPMIIDTPLARLDSEHRIAIVERYFPEASHQVLVLSTDTEVDEKLLGILAPAISHSYRLDYDPATRATTATPGYFGTTDQEVANALLQG